MVWHVQRELCKADLWFLLVYILHRRDCDCDWVWARCCEVQRQPDGYLDLWARGHYKSTIITYALTIQDILKNPDITVGIFSFNRPIAKAFLSQIKREFETNEELMGLFNDILWEKPTTQAPRWSEDSGIIVKRASNPKESTIEAWGLVDGQPTSKHYSLMVFDDVITKDSVSSIEMIGKVTSSWELSLNLAGLDCRKRYIGTRYDYGDTYKTIMDRQAAIPRIYPAEMNGEPIFLTREALATKRKEMGPYTYSAQMMQNPNSESTQGFKEDWLKFWNPANIKNLNLYIFVDPASSKKKYSDFTAKFVIGLGADLNYYVVDIGMDRLNLAEKTRMLFGDVRLYRPRMTYWERYGPDTQVEHIRDKQAEENFRFPITELHSPQSKEDRIAGLVPYFEQGRIYLPYECIKHTTEGDVDLVKVFMDQYRSFPYCKGHEDLLDCLADITLVNLSPPNLEYSQQIRAVEDADIYGLETVADSVW